LVVVTKFSSLRADREQLRGLLGIGFTPQLSPLSDSGGPDKEKVQFLSINSSLGLMSEI